MSQRLVYDPNNDYYDLLGVPLNATPDAIQRAYHRRAKETHPDINPDRREWATHTFKQLTEAYDVLSDPALRARYDGLRGSRRRPGASGDGGDPTYAPPPYQDFLWPRKTLRRRRSSIEFGPWIALMFLLSAAFCVGGFFAVVNPSAGQPAGAPKIAMSDTSTGCVARSWVIDRLALELDPNNAPLAVRVYGAASEDLFVLALNRADWQAPAQSGLMLGPVIDGFLARLSVPNERGVAYTVTLRAAHGSRPACAVAFEIE